MQVTRSNILETAPILLKKIKEAHFIALDFEMTGLNRSELLRNNGFDTVNSIIHIIHRIFIPKIHQ